jgi:hypothetical protein
MNIIKRKKVDNKGRVSKEKNKFKNIKPDSSFKNIIIVGSKEEEDNIIENVPKVFDSLIIKQNEDFTFCISPVKSKETSEIKDISESKEIYESKDISEIEKSGISKEEKFEKKEKDFVLEEVENEINIEIIGIKEEKKFEEIIPSNDVVNIELIGENIEEENKFKILKKERNVNEIELINEKIVKISDEDLIIENENVEILGIENIKKEDEGLKIPEFNILEPTSNIIKLELLSQKEEKDGKIEEKKTKEKLELIPNVNEFNIEATELEKEFENLICEENISINFIGNEKENELEIQKKNKKEDSPQFKRVSIEKKKEMEDKKSKEELEKKPLTTLEDIITKKEIEENIPETNYIIEHFDITNQGNIKREIDLLTSSTNEIEILGIEKEEPELEIITNINELIIEGKEKEIEIVELNKEEKDRIKEKDKLLKFTPHELEYQIIGKSKQKEERKKVTFMEEKTKIKEQKDSKIDFSIDNETLEIKGYDKDEKEIQTIDIDMNKEDEKLKEEPNKKLKTIPEKEQLRDEETNLDKEKKIPKEEIELPSEKEEKDKEEEEKEKEENKKEKESKVLKKTKKTILKTIHKKPEKRFDSEKDFTIQNENIIINGNEKVIIEQEKETKEKIPIEETNEEPENKINLLKHKTILQKSKIKKEDEEEDKKEKDILVENIDSIEKISRTTQTKIPLLKIHKEKFSIIQNDSSLSLSESDSFRLIEKLPSSIEKSDRSEKTSNKNMKIKVLETK